MSTRRTFLKNAGLITPAMLLMPDLLLAAKKYKNVGIQLYTLRELVAKDARGTIEKVAASGFTEVEMYGFGKGGFFGIPIKEFASFMSSLGLKVPSGHYMPGKFIFEGTDAGKAELDEMVGAALELKSPYLTIPYLPADKRASLDDYKKIAARLNEAGTICKKAALQLVYHNHDFEFKSYDGTTGFDIMTSETDKDLVKWELDLFWAVYAGIDPVELFEKMKGRIPLWHVKDMDKANRAQNTEIGNGTIDYKRIFKAAKTSGMKHFFLEHETNYVPDHIGSIQKSIAYIKANLL